jgi:hypothetical protein
MKDNAITFPHDCKARNNSKIVKIRIKYGYEGYGWYFAILELLRDTPSYTYENDTDTLKYCLGISSDNFDDFFDLCFEVGLLQDCEDGTHFTCENLKKSISRTNNMAANQSSKGMKHFEPLHYLSFGITELWDDLTEGERQDYANAFYKDIWENSELWIEGMCRMKNYKPEFIKTKLKEFLADSIGSVLYRKGVLEFKKYFSNWIKKQV